MTQPGLSILVVDDDPSAREMIRDELKRRGCFVTAAENALEGLRAILLWRFDAVVTNLLKPSRGGSWLWGEATALRPELRGRFIFYGAGAVPETFDGPLRSERFLPEELDPSVLWAEVRAVTDQGQDKAS